MKNLPTIAGLVGIALIISGPLNAQTSSASSAAPAAGTSSTAGGSTSAANRTAPPTDASAPTTATAGTDAQAPSTVARPAVPTTSPVAPITSTVPATASTPAADVRATTQDPRADLTSPATRSPTATATGASQTAATDALRREGGTSRRILGPAPTVPSPSGEGTTAGASSSLSAVPPVGVSSTATVAYLRAVEPSQRTAALNRVEAQLADTNRAINRLPQTTPSAPAAAQVDYAAALQEVQARESQLRSSLVTAQQADEAQWAEARNRLAADYDAYIAATHRVRAAAVNLDPTVAPAE